MVIEFSLPPPSPRLPPTLMEIPPPPPVLLEDCGSSTKLSLIDVDAKILNYQLNIYYGHSPGIIINFYFWYFIGRTSKIKNYSLDVTNRELGVVVTRTI